MKDKIYERVKKYITAHNMVLPEDCVLAGVSGGADSVCMLHLLWRLQEEISFRLCVVHVDHGLRAEAGEDAAFVAGLCSQWKLPFFLREVDMPGYAAEKKVSLEEAGRLLRYQTFAEVLGEVQGADTGKIAVAHNAEDRAETMLFHMFRGSGLKGLGSIRPVRESVIRPLLSVSREEIETYLADQGLSYREDHTNQEDAYARNRIRHHILPYAEREICHGTVHHMGDLADILAETEDYLERETCRLYHKYVEEQPGKSKMFLPGLQTEDDVMIKRVLLYALERITPYRKDITSRHIKNLLALVEKDGSKTLSLPYGIRACKEYDLLFLRQEERDTEIQAGKETGDHGRTEILVEIQKLTPGEVTEITVPGTGSFRFLLWEAASLPKDSLFYRKEQNIPENRYTKWFDYDKITTSLLLRSRRMGDYFTIDDASHTQSLKQYMINEKIPRGQRDGMCLLAENSHVLWLPGYRDSAQYKVGKNTRRILEVCLRGGNDGGTNRGIVVGSGS